jgi:multicomponent Na+:H+ antiporter subunit D
MIIWFVAVPIAAAVVIPFMRKFAPVIFVLSSIITLGLSLSLVPARSAVVFQSSLFGVAGNITLVADGFSVLMLILISFVGLIVGVFSLKWTEEYTFYSLLSVALVGMNGLVLVTDIFTMYVFLEITSLSSFALIALVKNAEGLEAAYKYLILSAVATAFILLGTFLMYGAAGGVSFAEISRAAADPVHSGLVSLCLVLFVIGFAIKAGLVPFHAWVLDAYSAAPNPISIALAGIVTKAAGVYTLCRIVFGVIGITPAVSETIMALGLASAVIGAVAAITQNDSKRLLAYSSISQVGYIILGIGTGTPLGITGGIFHLFNHAILKSLLFLNTAAIEKSTGSRDLSSMGGLGSSSSSSSLSSNPGGTGSR